MIDISAEYLRDCGLVINVNKSHTVSLKNVPHEKRSVVDPNCRFNCLQQQIKPLQRTEEWKYLGVQFTSDGRAIVDVQERLTEQLEKLSKAPLKPQQRLFGLRTTLLPGTYHQLVLGATRISTLIKSDRVVRRYVRKWLNLPKDVPVAYFHSTVKDGGLGIPSLRWNVPYMRLARLNSLKIATNSSYLETEIGNTKNRLRDKGQEYNNRLAVQERWWKELYSKMDGKALRESNKTPAQHQWVGEGTRFLTGKDYINLVKLRINALPVRARTSRGRRSDKLCRAGCLKIETANHVLQECHRTHDSRIQRHNAVTSYLARNLKRLDYDVYEEPHFLTTEGLRKPDIIAKRDGKAFIIDAQVVSEQADLEKGHRAKITYYQPLEPEVKERYGVNDVILTSATLTWRGIWSPTSCQQLLQEKFLKKKEVKVISTRVLIGGYAAWNKFNKRTYTNRRNRAGIG